MDPPVRLYLLGGFRVERNGEVIPPRAWLRRETARSLVKLLALQPDHRLHRDQVLDILWPQADPDSALSRLGKALHAARRALQPDLLPRQPSTYIHLHSDVLSLDVKHVWVDIDAFTHLASDAIASRNAAALERALESHGGEVLPEDRYEDWVTDPRQALAAQHLQILTALAAVLEERGARTRATKVWNEVLQRDPLHEPAYLSLMRLAESRAEAMRWFDRLAEVLDRELGVEPGETTRALRTVLLSRPGAGRASDRPLLPSSVPDAETALVGRDDVLRYVRDVLAGLPAGTGLTLLVRGEPGVGKTRMLSEIARTCAARGATVVRGTVRENGPAGHFGPFLDALESHLVHRSAADHRELARRYPALAPFLPSLCSTGKGDSYEIVSPAEGDRERLLANLVSLLSHLNTGGPLVLALDDLHLASADTLALFDHLRRVAAHRPWLLAATYGDGDFSRDGPFAALLSSMDAELGACEIVLERLLPTDTARLVELALPGGTVSEDLIHEVMVRAAGSPRFILDFLRTMRDDGTLRLTADRWVTPGLPSVPPRSAAVIATRLARLGEETGKVLAAAAIQTHGWRGADLEGTVAAAYPAMGKDALLAALDVALERRVIVERGGRYSFAHPLVRLAILDALPLHRRRHLHAVTARTILASYPGDIETLAYHFSRGEDEEAAIQYLGAAAERAWRHHAHSDTAGHLRQLVALLALRDRPHDLAVAHRRLGAALTTLGSHDDALHELAAAVALFRDGGWIDDLLIAVAHVTRAHAARGSIEKGRATALDALSLYAALASSRARATLLTALAQVCWQAGRYGEQLAAAEEAMALPPETDGAERWTGLRAALWRGVALVALERYQEGIEALHALLPAADEAGDLLTVSRASNTIAAYHQERGAFAAQEPYLERAFTAAERLGDPVRTIFLLHRRGWHRWMVGRWDEALIDLEDAAALDRVHGPCSTSTYVHYALASLHFARGGWETAAAHLGRALVAARRNGDVRMRWATHCLWAELDLARGNPMVAARRLKRVPGTGLTEGDRAYTLRLYAEVHLAAGRVEEADRAIVRARLHATAHADRPTLAEVLRVEGMVSLASGDQGRCHEALTQALALARDMGNPYSEARVLRVVGAAAAAVGRDAEADHAVSRAATLFRQVGAQRAAVEAEDALRARLTSVSGTSWAGDRIVCRTGPG